MEVITRHQELLVGIGLGALPLLLPAINRRLAIWTNHRWMKKGFQVADALRDGAIDPEDVERLLGGGSRQPERQ